MIVQTAYNIPRMIVLSFISFVNYTAVRTNSMENAQPISGGLHCLVL